MRVPIWTLVAMASLTAGLMACDPMDPGESGNLVPRTVVEDPTLPQIAMNGSAFHLETFGNPANPVIVFLHGGPGGDYRGMLRLGARYNGYSLADEYFLVFWDQRGSGLSMRHNKDVLTEAQYLADLTALVDRYSPGRPVYLVGHSWGSMYATMFINEHPERVAGAVLIETGPLDGKTFERIKGDIEPLQFGAEWLNDAVWSNQFFTANDHARVDYQRLLGMKVSQPRSHERIDVDPEPVWRLGGAAGRYLLEDGQNSGGVAVYDFTTNLARYTTPVLFVTGALSEILGASLQQTQMSKYPSATLTVVPNAGHDVQWTKAAEVVAPIHNYLTARRGGAQ